ncbi:17260_t:CDS:2 [Funneliformis geosporum]|uniref:7542_t:CDS:1 n=1 Tax=Funneliformis geosporum TaxID=1117311 RepID=A0A9W4SBS9_9GLOM|nr:7542_t:CDS:2 [Funneliformis geosporum]CAI2161652.1 17260_t:CDS:2 [Funneliformis geosporum]
MLEVTEDRKDMIELTDTCILLGDKNWKGNETRSSSIIMDTSIATDPDEAARRASRAQRFSEFLEPQQLVGAKVDAKIGGDVKRPSVWNGVKSITSSKKSDEVPSYTMEDVEWFLGALWYAWRVSKLISNSPSIPERRKRAQDFFIDSSPPVSLFDLRCGKHLNTVDDSVDEEIDNKLSSLIDEMSLSAKVD